MSIQINISTIKCHAGSTISGTVSVHGEKDFDVQSIAISLGARCKTKIKKTQNNHTSVYRGRAQLFHDRKVLFTGPHTLHPGHSWPFSFTLPLRCAAVGVDPFKQPHGLFNVARQQTLPPAIKPTSSSFGYSECSISYQLEAKLVGSRPTLLSSGDFDATRDLDFTTSRNIDNPEPQPITKPWPIIRSSLLLEPGREYEKLSFKDKMKSMRTSKLPTAKFTIKTLIPSLGVVNKNLTIILSIVHDIEGSSAPAPPMVFLKKFSVYIKSFTHIRAIRNELFVGDIERTWDESVKIASWDSSAQMAEATPITEGMDLGQFKKIAVPSNYRPSFSTFNIRRYYRLGVRLTVECAQKTYKMDFETSNFLLLAANYTPSDEVGAPGTSTTNEVEDLAAPVYEAKPGVTLPRYED